MQEALRTVAEHKAHSVLSLAGTDCIAGKEVLLLVLESEGATLGGRARAVVWVGPRPGMDLGYKTDELPEVVEGQLETAGVGMKPCYWEERRGKVVVGRVGTEGTGIGEGVWERKCDQVVAGG